MASPQKENGHTQIAHEILEATARYSFNGSQHSILLIVWRMTYGWQGRKSHDFSITYLMGATGLSKAAVRKELTFLIESNVLKVIDGATNKKARKLSFNKDYDYWKVKRRGEPLEQINLFEDNNCSTQENLEYHDCSTQSEHDCSTQSKENPYLESYDCSTNKESKSLNKSFKENVDVLFNRFYEIYPRKVSKIPAMKAWAKLAKKENFDPERIIANTLNFAETVKLLKTETKFIPHPSTYLNQERFRDYKVIDPEGLAAKKKSKLSKNIDLLLGGFSDDGSASQAIDGEGISSLPEPSRD